MPDRSRYPWLPRENAVDPTVFLQLDPRKRPNHDGEDPHPDTVNKPDDLQVKTTKPPSPGGGPDGGGPVPPPPVPPSFPPPEPEIVPPGSGSRISPVKPPRVGAGSVHNPPPGYGVTPQTGVTPPVTPPFPNVRVGPGVGGPSDPPLPPVPTMGTGSVSRPSGGAPSGGLTPPLPPMPTMGMGPMGGGDDGGAPTGGTAGGSGGFVVPPPPVPPSGGGEDVGSTIDYGNGPSPVSGGWTLPGVVTPTPTPSPIPSTLTGGDPDIPDWEKWWDNPGDDADHEYENLAKGGIVNKPTRARIGESGPEMVVPVGPRMKYGRK